MTANNWFPGKFWISKKSQIYLEAYLENFMLFTFDETEKKNKIEHIIIIFQLLSFCSQEMAFFKRFNGVFILRLSDEDPKDRKRSQLFTKN